VPADAAPGARDWDGHLLLLHRTEHERVGRLAEWMRHGLRRGEKILYIEPTDSGPASVTVDLRRYGIDTDALRADRRLEILSPQAYYPVGGPEAATSRSLAEGFPAVRISGAATSAFAVVSEAGHRDIEWGVDRLCREWPVSALCQYAYPTSTGPVLRNVLGMHPGGFHEESLSGSGTRSPLVLHGSIDETNAEVLAALVDAATDRAGAASGLRRLHLDLTGIDHLAPTACRAVARASEPFRGDGGKLVLDNAGPVVEDALRAAIADLPGVELIAAAP
jgi:MEDS: MEthanogen/methylotroph, DcmR Sensory domain